MKCASLWFVLIGVSLTGSPGRAEETLAQWAAGYEKPDIQQKILNGIFPGQIGPVSTASIDKAGGTYAFPKGSSWVQLSREKAWGVPKPPGASPYLIVTCMLFHRPGEDPMSAVSYLFRGTDRRPVALSAGYASRERIYQVALPKLGKTFLLFIDAFGNSRSASLRWSATLLESDDNGPRDRPRQVWTSPWAYHAFQLGFSELNGNAEELALRPMAAEAGRSDYAAYQWDGRQFSPDSFASQSRLSQLPDSVWQYGTGR